MNADSFTEVTHQSWFGRIGNALKGIIVGIILCIVSIGLLFWNEGRSVKTYKMLQMGRELVVPVASADKVDSKHENELVHLSAKAETTDTLTDPRFGVSDVAIQLRRRVEMYQWEEDQESKTEKKLGGGTDTKTTYSYKKVWKEGRIDSGGFKNPGGHENPEPGFPSETFAGEHVTFGAFKLPPSLIGKISQFKDLPFTQEMLDRLPEGLLARSMLDGGKLYLAREGYMPMPGQPEVGDLRIAFSAVAPMEVSLIARQIGDTFEPYTTKYAPIELLEPGRHSADEMFSLEEHRNATLTWILRLVGWILAMFGIGLILQPMSVLADVVPLFGSLVGMGLSIVSLLLGTMIACLVIAVAWLFYRPLLAACLLIGVGLLIALLIYTILTFRRRAKAAKAEAA